LDPQVIKSLQIQGARVTIFLTGILVVHFVSIATNSFSNGPILCPFRLITGHICPGCGLTRAIGELAQGHLGRSLQLNPIGIILVLGVTSWVITPKNSTSIYMLAKGKLTRVHPKVTLTFCAILYVALWIWDLQRQIPDLT